jgi:hypothetical protein
MGLISTGPGSPLAFASASGGKIYAYNNISESAAIQVAPANQFRTKLLFHNPGTNDLFVAPVNVQNTGSNVTLSPSNATLGGCFRVYGNGGTLVIEGECQGAYQAFSVTGAGTTNPLTVMDSNV